MLLLMNHKDITRDFILLDLYHDDITFYFSPSTVFLSAISASSLITLYLNKKIELNDGEITILDDNCYQDYHQMMMDYIKERKLFNIKELASELFADSDFSLSLYEKVIENLSKDGLIKVEKKTQFILNKNSISLVDEEAVRSSYLKLYETLFNDDESQEFVALALVIDTFFMIDDYFDEDQHDKIKESLVRLKDNELYNDIIVFKDVIDEFYSLITHRSTNYFGI
ncbi:MAG: hypothetical protein RR425_03690 [Erysipelotrichales bacterium]